MGSLSKPLALSEEDDYDEEVAVALAKDKTLGQEEFPDEKEDEEDDDEEEPPLGDNEWECPQCKIVLGKNSTDIMEVCRTCCEEGDYYGALQERIIEIGKLNEKLEKMKKKKDTLEETNKVQAAEIERLKEEFASRKRKMSGG